jgi:protein-arginine kinase activator protein McsA
MKTCQICQEEAGRLLKHHVKPKCKGGTHAEIAYCCKTCAKQVHVLFNNNELAMMSLKELLATEQMQKYIKWKKKHPGEFRGVMSNKVKKWKQFHR